MWKQARPGRSGHTESPCRRYHFKKIWFLQQIYSAVWDFISAPRNNTQPARHSIRILCWTLSIVWSMPICNGHWSCMANVVYYNNLISLLVVMLVGLWFCTELVHLLELHTLRTKVILSVQNADFSYYPAIWQGSGWDSSSPATFFAQNISISEHKANTFEITDNNLHRFKQMQSLNANSEVVQYYLL
jgi:hypothetical protein